MPDIYIPTADSVLPDSKIGSTVYEIVMLSISVMILLITAVVVLVTILRKYWKKCRSLEEPSTRAVVMVSFSHERNGCHGIPPPNLSSQPHISSICEVVFKKCKDTCEQRDASFSRPIECFIDEIHITM